ncbi:hypothetical protein GPY61_22885 [Massilia sp. NEAU-DD11]|uniref:Uncharacterized protein n=1 Tax=Massilia cellulosiltytica TaxID=2683234 RepID=A0A7X3K9X5_9BURK|nr:MULTISPECIES: hypothetical protein [Telluria group]MVW62780.1 hypothetical protein [Telluria cellulosilytica]
MKKCRRQKLILDQGKKISPAMQNVKRVQEPDFMDSPQSPPIPANARHGNTSLPLWPPDETWAPGLELPNPGHHALHLRSAREEIMPPMSATVRCKRIPPPCWKSRISNTPQPRIEQKNTLNVRFAVAESIFLQTMMMAFQSQWATGSTLLNHRNP